VTADVDVPEEDDSDIAPEEEDSDIVPADVDDTTQVDTDDLDLAP